MTSNRFVSLVLVGVLAAACVIVPLNMREDIYGLFRSSAGRHLFVSGEARTAKYLHSFRYIPENFDGVLFGSSISENLETRDLGTYRIYNASINGGNIEDVKPIAENVYRKRDLKITIMCIHRYLTNDHAVKTDLMTPKQYWGALGSPQLLTAYLSRAAESFGLAANRFDEYGSVHYDSDPGPENVRKSIQKAADEIQHGTASVGNYYIDPVALSDLNSVLRIARQHSRELVVVYPPVPSQVLALRSAEYSKYCDTINSLLQPSDIVLDFNGSSYESMRENPANFVDAVHLSRTGAAAVVSALGKLLETSPLVNTASLRR